MKKERKGLSTRFRVAAAVIGTSVVLSATMPGLPAQASTTQATSKHGGSAVVAINEPFSGMCFTALVAGPAISAMSSIFEPLFTKSTTGKPIGLLATGATPSNDFKTWTITLRPNVSYTNGQSFNADSVIENMNYWRGAKYVYPATNLWTLGGGVTAFANIVALRKIDDLTVAVDLFKSQNDLPEQLSWTGFSMRASAQLASAAACTSTAIGTGPFVVDTFSTNELVLSANPNYWRTDPTKPKVKLPYLSKLTFLYVPESSQRAASVRTKSVDAAIFTGRTDNTFIADLKQRKSVVTVYDSPIHYYPSFFLNQGNGGPFSDINARRAVVSCIDRVNFNKVRLKGRGQVPTSVVGKENILYNTKGFPQFSIKKSKAYVAAYLAAHPEKTSLSFNIPFEGASQSQNTGKFLQSTFAKCGITMNIVTEEQAIWASKAFNVLTGRNAYDAVFTGVITLTGAAMNFPFLATNVFPTDSTNPLRVMRSTLGVVYNLTKHTDTSIDDLLWQARAATTEKATKKAYAAVTQKIQEQAIFTSIANFGWSYVTNNQSKLSTPGQVVIKKGTKAQAVGASWMDWAGISKG